MAMDFSGRIGRVIDNPVEAQSAAMEEGHAWRVRRNLGFYVISVNNARSKRSLRMALFILPKYSYRAKFPLVVNVDFSVILS